ncbi:response regulator MprA [Acrasis kona]|uniref:Response regulator MprA n=1 Tax=Acrasis kona TaxID=1008807 RepID=A0AAW2ZKF2_9EUKA
MNTPVAISSSTLTFGAFESSQTYRSPSKEIILVDSFRITKDIMGRLLSMMGYKVTCISSGEDLLEYFVDNHFDLIAEDNLPVVVLESWLVQFSGLEAAQQIKQIHPSMKIIMLTCFNNQELLEGSEVIDMFLVKPVQSVELDSAIRQLIP